MSSSELRAARKVEREIVLGSRFDNRGKGFLTGDERMLNYPPLIEMRAYFSSGTQELFMDQDTQEYRPSADEPYMNPRQLEYFRARLLDLRKKTQQDYENTFARLTEERERDPDIVDQGTLEADIQMDFHARERSFRLLREIERALARIDDGTYGYCEETDEEIGLRRLEARPLATLCIEAQEKREQFDKVQRGVSRI
jgi:DnaK suppressor protein